MPSVTPKSQLPNLPRIEDPALYDYLVQMHGIIANLHASAQAPGIPTNLTVTPIAGGNVVGFTRSNGVSFNLYAASSPNRAAAQQVNLGSANQYTDNVGSGGILRYYWVEALNQSGGSSGISTPRSGTTLALTAPATIIPPQPSFAEVFDTTVNRNVPVIPAQSPDISPPQPPQS